MDKEERRARGARAQSLLDDPLLQEAFRTLEAEYTKAWVASEPTEVALREFFHKAINILGDVRRHLVKVSADGRLAQAEIDRLT